MQDSPARRDAATFLPRTFRIALSAAVALSVATVALPADAQTAKSSRSSASDRTASADRPSGGSARRNARPSSSARSGGSARMREHEVKDGETLWSISRRYHVSVDAIKDANEMGSSTTIRPGRTLRIPRAAAEHAVAAAERREAHDERAGSRTAPAEAKKGSGTASRESESRSRRAARPTSATRAASTSTADAEKKSSAVPARAALRVGSSSSRRVERVAMPGRLAERSLMVPVVGIAPSQLRDSYDQARSEGRVHDAIDIHAPRGTPVVAVADGRVLRFHEGARGGRSIYLLDGDGRTRYYYAHLDRYEDGLGEGDRVRQGQVIGYVGDTGNAQPGDYHLHFSISILSSAGRWWQGDNVNPYPLLRKAEPAEVR